MTAVPFVVDLVVLRDQTDTFISVLPTTLVLRRSSETRTNSGGRRRGEPVSLPPQTFSLIEPGDSAGVDPTRASDGEYREADFILLGRYDADMEVGDTFDLETQPGRSFRLVEILFNNGWEKRARVLREGREDLP